MKKAATDWSLKTVINNCETTDLQQTAISSRYKESVFTFRHADVINGKINTLIMPEMEVSRMDIDAAVNITASQDDGLERCVCTFIYKGNIHTNFTDTNTRLEQNRQQHSFVHASSGRGEHTITAGSTSILYINLQPALLEAYMPLWDAYAGKLYQKSSYKKLYVSPPLPVRQQSRMQQILLAMYSSNTFNGATRSLFTEAKAMELLALQLEELIQLSSTTSLQTFTFSKSDREKLVAMHEYITQQYLMPLSLRSLAKQFTLNEFKLKKGFKELYHQSVFNYIHTLRMQHAKMLLQQDNRMVNEVADLVGYSSIHNFSNAFYKKFGYRPGMLKTAAKASESGNKIHSEDA